MTAFRHVTLALDEYPPIDIHDKRICRSCRDFWGGIPFARDFPVLNTNTGKYHSGNEYGKTDCGKDATRDNWLWPL